MNTNHRISALAFLIFALSFSVAGSAGPRYVKEAGIRRYDDRLVVTMDIDLSGMKFTGGE